MRKGQQSSQQALEQVREAGGCLFEINNAMRSIIAMNAKVVDRVEAHQTLVTDIDTSMAAIGNLATDTAGSSTQVSNVTKEFIFLARQLEHLVDQFLHGPVAPEQTDHDQSGDTGGTDVELF